MVELLLIPLAITTETEFSTAHMAAVHLEAIPPRPTLDFSPNFT